MQSLKHNRQLAMRARPALFHDLFEVLILSVMVSVPADPLVIAELLPIELSLIGLHTEQAASDCGSHDFR